MPRKNGFPSLTRHKGRSLGVSRIGGRDRYFGHWPEGMAEPPLEVRKAYDLAIAEWLAGGRLDAPPARAAAPALTVEGMATAFYDRHVLRHCVGLDGEPTLERDNFAYSLRPLCHLFGATPAAEFGPSRLKAVRAHMVAGYAHPAYGDQEALARTTVNQRVGRIKAAFKWAASEELVPASVWHALQSVEGLKAGRSAAKEARLVGPADPAAVERTLPFLGTHAAGLVRFLRLTGARCGEACRLALAEIDRTGDVWLYSPARHKTARRKKPRVIAIGPKGQAVLWGFIRIRCPLCGAEGRPPRLGSPDGALCGRCADR
ncbi:MAG: hypothetical protein K2W96_13845, partial [Gemmataceae bacterium]|nr:hypothetical protein [Gemmataceae bacterium]